ncbi:MAG TPA: sensor domain-containing diguanylate cyclase [Planctomycetota bacterium]|nr:sensor domain-containing diguanylate cyclase [Planctomycetota bacterium]
MEHTPEKSLPSAQRLLQIIHTQTEIVKSDLDLTKVMDLVAQRAPELTGGSGGVVELAEGAQMVYRATTGTATNYLGLRIQREGSLSGLCVATGKPLVCHDTETDPRVDLQACRKVGARSMVVAPLLYKNKPVGVLKVLSPLPNAFKQEDITTLELMSELVAASMTHASNFQTQAEESKLLFMRATQDSLTGLANRALFYDRMRLCLAAARRDKFSFAVEMLDMDGLKQLNDSLGHAAGDAALRELGTRMRRTTRDADTAARLGGDEFAIILAHVADRQAALNHSRRLAEIIDAPFQFDSTTQLQLRASIGVAVFPDDGKEIDTLIHFADEVMYAAKRRRKGTA